MLLHQANGQVGITFGNGLRNRFVFMPNGLSLMRRLQDSAHDTFQMVPMQIDALRNQRVSRGLVNGPVKGQIGIDHGFDVLARFGLTALLKNTRGKLRAAFGSQTNRQSVQTAAYLVNLGNPSHIQLGHLDTSTRCVFHKTVFFEQPQCLQNGLARNCKSLCQVFLGQAFARLQCAFADGVEQTGINLFDQIRGRGQLNQMWLHVCIQNTVQAVARQSVITREPMTMGKNQEDLPASAPVKSMG